MSSINPFGAKCWTPQRVRAASAAGFRIGLVHEGWGGTGGGRGISAIDGLRDGRYCHKAAPTLGAPKGACVYFACDTDFSAGQISSLAVPYFQEIGGTFADGLYRIGVYGSGLTCETLKDKGLVDLTWIAGSKGWTAYSQWVAKADIVQTVDANLGGISDDSDLAQSEDIGDYVPDFGVAA